MEKMLCLMLLVASVDVALARPAVFVPRAAFKLPAKQQLLFSYRTDLSVPPVPSFPAIFPSVVRAHTSPVFQGPQILFHTLKQPLDSFTVFREHAVSSSYQEPHNPILTEETQALQKLPSVIRAHSSPLYQEPQNGIRAHSSPLYQEPQNGIRAHSSPLYQEPQNFIATANEIDGIPSQSSSLLQTIQQPIFSSVVGGQTPSNIVYSPVISQTRSQDEKGGYYFSYSGGPSSRTEERDHNGVVRGAYSYIDPNGILQKYHYIADANGFRVTNSLDIYPGQSDLLRKNTIPEIIIARTKKLSELDNKST